MCVAVPSGFLSSTTRRGQVSLTLILPASIEGEGPPLKQTTTKKFSMERNKVVKQTSTTKKHLKSWRKKLLLSQRSGVSGKHLRHDVQFSLNIVNHIIIEYWEEMSLNDFFH